MKTIISILILLVVAFETVLAQVTQEWFARYNGTGNSSDEATSIAVDGSGNTYVTGRSSGSGTSLDYATIKYNSAGALQWSQRYNGPGDSSDYATSIALDDSGNVYVTGYSYGSGTGYDCATIKCNTAGVEQWIARYNGPGNSNDVAIAIALDDSGNVYVTGYSYTGDIDASQRLYHNKIQFSRCGTVGCKI